MSVKFPAGTPILTLKREPKMQQILLVEDSEEARTIVLDTLGQHYRISTAETVDEAQALLATEEFSLILLDLNLPRKDGYTLLSALQSDPRTSQIPVICLTGKTETSSKVAAFTMGVEDYIVKPFDTLELRVRVEAKLKKVQRARDKSDHITVGRLQIDRENYTVHITEGSSRKEVSLTPTEFKILCHLARQPERVFSREQLMTAVWGNNAEVFDRAVDVHMSGVRRKLGELGDYLQAVPGVGYKLSPAVTSKKKAA